jgi:GT2 family glycosyltransferase
MEESSTGPRVTALIVARNCAGDLRRCLEALDKTTPHEMLEILVVDNGSRDESATLDSEFPSAQFLRLPKNFGATKALNIGLRTAKGEYVFLLPPQAVVEPAPVPKLVDRLVARPDAGAVCPRTHSAYPLPDVAALGTMWKTGVFPGARTVDTEAGEVEVDFPKGAPILVRRAFIASMNYFDNRFGDFGPYLELCWQVRSSGKKILVLPDVVVEGSEPTPPSQDTAAVSDRVNGSVVYAGKHFGTGAGVGLRIKAALTALGSFDFGLLAAIVAGQKIDGNQSGA